VSIDLADGFSATTWSPPGEIQIAMVNGSDPDPVRCAARVTSGGKLHIVALGERAISGAQEE
jgi:hypothetical protein